MYFSAAGVTEFCGPRPDFFPGNVIRVPTKEGGEGGFPKEKKAKKVYCRTFSTSANSCPLYVFKSGHSD